EYRDLCRLARRLAQRGEVRPRRLTQVEPAGDDVAEDKTLEAELIGAVHLVEEARLLERRQQPERGGARNAGAARQVGERQARLAKREDAEQLERLRRRIDLVARGRHHADPSFHWVKRYIVP